MNLLFSLKSSGTVLACLAAIMCEVLFGFSFLFTKNATNSVSPCDLLGWRFAAAAFLMILCVLFRLVKINFKGKNVLPLLVTGLFFPGAYYICEAFGVSIITASESGMLVACVPAITLLLSMIFLGERPSSRQVFGIILCILGVIICVCAKSFTVSFHPLGYLLIISGILFFCFFTIMTKKADGFTPMEKSFVFLMEAFVIYFTIALIKNGISGHLSDFLLLPVRNRNLLYAISYLASACSIVCLFLCNYSIACIGPARFGSFIGIETIVSISAGILILGEPCLWQQIVGAVIVITGVYLANAGMNK